MLKKYKVDGGFDEMLCVQTGVRGHYQKFHKTFEKMTPKEFDAKREAIDTAFLRQGITFNVYGAAQGAEKIFPFDLLPRIIPAKEWEFVGRGPPRRRWWLILFFHNIYHEKKFWRGGFIRNFFFLPPRHFRREFVNF